MKKIIFNLLIASCFLFIAHVSAAPAALYVQSVKAYILSAPSLGSAKIADAAKGESLKELEKKGDWYKVSYRDKTGWVSRLLVSYRPPSGKVSLLEVTKERIEKGARKRASAFTTAAAARGLAEDRARLSDKYKVDYKSLEAMESVNVSDGDAMDFLKKISDYK